MWVLVDIGVEFLFITEFDFRILFCNVMDSQVNDYFEACATAKAHCDMLVFCYNSGMDYPYSFTMNNGNDYPYRLPMHSGNYYIYRMPMNSRSLYPYRVPMNSGNEDPYRLSMNSEIYYP
jgi:hypothetical protein